MLVVLHRLDGSVCFGETVSGPVCTRPMDDGNYERSDVVGICTRCDRLGETVEMENVAQLLTARR